MAIRQSSPARLSSPITYLMRFQSPRTLKAAWWIYMTAGCCAGTGGRVALDGPDTPIEEAAQIAQSRSLPTEAFMESR